jgi:hypothetical protein
VSDGWNDPGLDVLRIMRVLNHHGAAAVIHGTERPTQDFDCVAQSDQENLQRLALAMRELNARLHVEGLTDVEASTLPLVLDAAMLARMEISTWRTDAGDLDILADIPDRNGQHMRFEELIERADSAVVGGLVVRVASLDDIIGSKVGLIDPRTVRHYLSCSACVRPRTRTRARSLRSRFRRHGRSGRRALIPP